MLSEKLSYDNYFGSVVLFAESTGFTVLYSFKKMPGVYRCRVHNADNYDTALRHYNRYVGVLRRKEAQAARNNSGR